MNNKFVKLFISINIILIAFTIIVAADANTTITKRQNIVIKTKDKNSAKKLKADLDKKIMNEQNNSMPSN
ncbi:MAG: hypothetical protein IKP65_01630 [Alphaproteobacteria bacterium]|nr:hypothetical protein [Alphaproteobacteria bacterium]